MANESREKIKASMLRRMRRIPKLAPGALDNEEDVGGVYMIEVPPETYQPLMVVDARGTFAFGGIVSENDNIFISKIVIDNEVIMDRGVENYLSSVFSRKTDSTAAETIAGNTPPFLVNDSIQIYAVNYSRRRGWWWSSRGDNMLQLSLVPIQ